MAFKNPRESRLGQRAQVASCKGRVESLSIHFAEGLHLHRSGKGDAGGEQDIRRRPRQQAQNQQNADLKPEDSHVGGARAAPSCIQLHRLRDPYACQKAQDCGKMLQARPPGTGEAVDSQQHDVAGHRIREDMTMPHIGEAVEKTSCRGE